MQNTKTRKLQPTPQDMLHPKHVNKHYKNYINQLHKSVSAHINNAPHWPKQLNPAHQQEHLNALTERVAKYIVCSPKHSEPLSRAAAQELRRNGVQLENLPPAQRRTLVEVIRGQLITQIAPQVARLLSHTPKPSDNLPKSNDNLNDYDLANPNHPNNITMAQIAQNILVEAGILEDINQKETANKEEITTEANNEFSAIITIEEEEFENAVEQEQEQEREEKAMENEAEEEEEKEEKKEQLEKSDDALTLSKEVADLQLEEEAPKLRPDEDEERRNKKDDDEEEEESVMTAGVKI